MKVLAALIIATVCASCLTEVSAAPQARASIMDTIIAKATELKDKILGAVEAAKGKVGSLAQLLGEKKDTALAKIKDLKDQLEAKYKNEIAPAADEFKQAVKDKIKDQIAKAIDGLETAKEKLRNAKE